MVDGTARFFPNVIDWRMGSEFVQSEWCGEFFFTAQRYNFPPSRLTNDPFSLSNNSKKVAVPFASGGRPNSENLVLVIYF